MMNLVKGHITFTAFEFFNEHKEKTLALCSVSADLQSRIHTIKEAFTARQLEQQSFMTFHKELADFWNFCRTAVSRGKLYILQ